MGRVGLTHLRSDDLTLTSSRVSGLKLENTKILRRELPKSIGFLFPGYFQAFCVTGSPTINFSCCLRVFIGHLLPAPVRSLRSLRQVAPAASVCSNQHNSSNNCCPFLSAFSNKSCLFHFATFFLTIFFLIDFQFFSIVAIASHFNGLFHAFSGF